ncbi:MAG: RNase adapter RapZ [Clostridia bacterium]|nr:RNase adapter RapZ [Clostridia bacterium]
MNFIIVTGISGAGKSKVADILEDIGYYCVDNMPSVLISRFSEIYSSSPANMKDVAFVVDVRGEQNFDAVLEQVSALRRDGNECKLLFVDCSDEIIIRRYKETRRYHPLAQDGSCTISDALKKERSILAKVRESADYLVDTTGLNLQQLNTRVKAVVCGVQAQNILAVCTSFGFKNGLPTESDLVFDVRCFPNPFYITELRDKTGLDSAVRDYVFSDEGASQFTKKLCDMMAFLLPKYIEEGKSQVNISIGCTGGKHRSVAIAEALRQYLAENNYNAICIHRDIQR